MFIDFLKIERYSVHEMNYCEPLQIFDKYANCYGSVLLTGRGDESNSRYSFIGINPNFDMICENNRLIINGFPFNDSIWKFWSETLVQAQFYQLDYPANLCGLIGFISYEFVRDIEKIPKTTVDSYKIPKVQFLAYKIYYVFDHLEEKAWQIILDYKKNKPDFIPKFHNQGFQIGNVTFETRKSEYIDKIKKIQQYIIQGDVYEVNLTQQVCADFNGNGFDFFKKLYSINDAPFSCYFNLGKLQIVSNSPELFLKAKGKQIETRPIKGTIPRNSDVSLDIENRNLLLSSEKDQAELFMIVDLLRNDLGKVAKIGSVKVVHPKKLESFKNVYHLVGIIKAELAKNFDYIDLIKAAFPGGSITGCPKIRSMEIIDELETYTRNLYTGSIFIMNQQFLNSSIVIRTAVIQKDKIFINSGGAITIDSVPEDEYVEMKTKIENILELLKL